MRKVHAFYLTAIILLLALNTYQYHQSGVQRAKYNTGVASLTIKLEEPKYGDLFVKEGMTVLLRKTREVKNGEKVIYIVSDDDMRVGTLNGDKKVTFNNLPRNSEWNIDLMEGTTTVHLTSYRVDKELDDELLIFGWSFQTKVTSNK